MVKPVRILQIVPNMDVGGLETLLMNLYRNIDREQVQFDFLVHYQRRCFFDDEIERLGGRIYRFSVREDNRVFNYIRQLSAFFKEHKEIQIVHGHMASLAFIYLFVAKVNGVPARIIHSHNDATEKTIKGLTKFLLSRFARCFATSGFACSQAAGEFLFGHSKFTLLKNGIDPEKFRFDDQVRQELRKSLGVEDQFVVGHVGRFCAQKNHSFLIDIFDEIQKQIPNAVLLLVGQGELEGPIHQKVVQLGLEEKVRFLGVRSDVNQLFQAIDAFVFPSLFEGLGIVAIESQAAGLMTFVSDQIPPEVNVTDLVVKIPLTAPAKEWADRIIARPLTYTHANTCQDIRQAGYDIRQIAGWLQDYYLAEAKKLCS